MDNINGLYDIKLKFVVKRNSNRFANPEIIIKRRHPDLIINNDSSFASVISLRITLTYDNSRRTRHIRSSQREKYYTNHYAKHLSHF
jgi:hypothetical protein